MSRVALVYDDGTKIEFNSRDDALYHVARQGGAGVVALHSDDAGNVGAKVWSRRDIDSHVRAAREHAGGGPVTVEAARKAAKAARPDNTPEA